MKCTKCHSKIKKTVTVCPYCKYEMTSEEIAIQIADTKKKRSRNWLIAIFTIIFLVSLVFYLALTSAFLVNVNIENSNIEFSNPLEISIQYTCSKLSYGDREYSADIYVDDVLIERYTGYIERGTKPWITYTLEHNFCYEPGIHTLYVEEYEDGTSYEFEFEVLSEPDIYIDFNPYDQIYIVNKDYDLPYSFYNEGGSTAYFEYSTKYDDKISHFTETIPSGEEIENSITVSSVKSGNKTIIIDYHEFDIMFYETARPDTGYPVYKKYGNNPNCIYISNNLDSDIVVTVVELDESTKINNIVSSNYIRKNEEYEIDSISNGSFCLVIQTGSDWISELSQFATDEKIYFSHFNIQFDSTTGRSQYIDYEFNEDNMIIDFYEYHENPLYDNETEYYDEPTETNESTDEL